MITFTEYVDQKLDIPFEDMEPICPFDDKLIECEYAYAYSEKCMGCMFANQAYDKLKHEQYERELL